MTFERHLSEAWPQIETMISENGKLLEGALFALALLTSALVSSCTSKMYYSEWRYSGIEEREAAQSEIHISTVPPKAVIYVDDVRSDSTPCILSLKHNKKSVIQERLLFSKDILTGPVEIEKEHSYTDFDIPETYVIKLVKPGYLDEVFPIRVPSQQDSYEIILQPSGIISDLACSITVEARPRYYRDIDSVLKKHAISYVYKGPTISIDPESSITRTPYQLVIRDSEDLERLVGDLKSLAAVKDFAFKIFDAKFSAFFSTTIIEAEIAHVVTGRIRKGAKLYLYVEEYDRFQEVPSGVPGSLLDESGYYTMPVRVRPDDRFIYFKSVYRGKMDSVLVYNRLDVFQKKGEEVSCEIFLRDILDKRFERDKVSREEYEDEKAKIQQQCR